MLYYTYSNKEVVYIHSQEAFNNREKKNTTLNSQTGSKKQKGWSVPFGQSSSFVFFFFTQNLHILKANTLCCVITELITEHLYENCVFFSFLFTRSPEGNTANWFFGSQEERHILELNLALSV